MPSRRPPPSLLDELSSDDDSPVVPAKKEESAPAAPVAAEPAVEEVTERLATAKVCVCPAGTGGGGACVCFPKTEAEEEEQAPVGGLRMIVGKKSKKQLQKEKKEAEARKRYEEAKEAMKDWDDPKVAEDQRLAMQLEPQGLKITVIQADGHCLYRALAHQCMRSVDELEPEVASQVATWEQGGGHEQMRRMCATFMKQHTDDFAPFVDTDDFGAYVDKIENSAEWGGDVELMALARRLKSHIHVYSAHLSEQTFSPDAASGVHLRVSFHKHAFGLGEHYNSVVPIA